MPGSTRIDLKLVVFRIVVSMEVLRSYLMYGSTFRTKTRGSLSTRRVLRSVVEGGSSRELTSGDRLFGVDEVGRILTAYSFQLP